MFATCIMKLDLSKKKVLLIKVVKYIMQLHN